MPGAFMVTAPGKLILCGEHAVVHGMLAVAAVVERRTQMEFKACDEVRLIIRHDQMAHSFSWALADVQALAPAWAGLAAPRIEDLDELKNALSKRFPDTAAEPSALVLLTACTITVTPQHHDR